MEKALELFERKKPEAQIVGEHPDTGRKLFLKQRQGYYLEVERTPEEIEKKVKPTWISLPPGADPRELSQNDLAMLCRLPAEIGNHPESGEPIVFRIAKGGPVIQCGKEFRDVEDWRKGSSLTLEQAMELLGQPKAARKRKTFEPIKEFGALEGADGPVKVMTGRFGPYVTDGSTNATIPKTMSPQDLTPEAAVDLLQKKKAAGSAKKRFVRRGKPKAKK